MAFEMVTTPLPTRADILAVGDVEPASVNTRYIAEPLLIGNTIDGA